jgi:hypothetical protein
MAIPFTCTCGKSIRVKDELAGRKARCPDCGTAFTIPVPQKPSTEDEAGDFLLADSPKEEHLTQARESPTKPPETKKAFRPGAVPNPPAPAPASVPTPTPTPTPPSAKPRSSLATLFAKKKISKDDEPTEWSGGIAIHPSILAGLAMMAGAAIWFFAGLAAGRIYFYPPILFCLGIGAIINGFRGTE